MKTLVVVSLVCILLVSLVLLPSLAMVFVGRVFKRFIKAKVLLWLINCVVFIVFLGAELLILGYFQAKQAARNVHYEMSGQRFSPYNPEHSTHQENIEKK